MEKANWFFRRLFWQLVIFILLRGFNPSLFLLPRWLIWHFAIAHKLELKQKFILQPKLVLKTPLESLNGLQFYFTLCCLPQIVSIKLSAYYVFSWDICLTSVNRTGGRARLRSLTPQNDIRKTKQKKKKTNYWGY